MTQRALIDAFAAAVAADPPDLVIATCALSPTTPTTDVSEQLDEIAGHVERGSLDSLRSVLAERYHFSGNSTNYYEAANSYLDRVLERRTGIPISLALLAIEVGGRCGVELVGIGMPGHFLVRESLGSGQLVDPFARFSLVTPAECRARFESMAPPGARWHDDYLAPVGPLAMLYRMTGNLQAIHERSRDIAALRHVLELRSLLPMASQRDRQALQLADARLN